MFFLVQQLAAKYELGAEERSDAQKFTQVSGKSLQAGANRQNSLVLRNRFVEVDLLFPMD